MKIYEDIFVRRRFQHDPEHGKHDRIHSVDIHRSRFSVAMFSRGCYDIHDDSGHGHEIHSALVDGCGLNA